jgi:hypothetical protein
MYLQKNINIISEKVQYNQYIDFLTKVPSQKPPQIYDFEAIHPDTRHQTPDTVLFIRQCLYTNIHVYHLFNL